MYVFRTGQFEVLRAFIRDSNGNDCSEVTEANHDKGSSCGGLDVVTVVDAKYSLTNSMSTTESWKVRPKVYEGRNAALPHVLSALPTCRNRYALNRSHAVSLSTWAFELPP